jgi:hypothetical protein
MLATIGHGRMLARRIRVQLPVRARMRRSLGARFRLLIRLVTLRRGLAGIVRRLRRPIQPLPQRLVLFAKRNIFSFKDGDALQSVIQPNHQSLDQSILLCGRKRRKITRRKHDQVRS